jgi:5-formyltetrahydrofolate cyclo-ligase
VVPEAIFFYLCFQMEKSIIRKTAAARRNALTPAELQDLSDQILAHFTQLDFTGIQVLHLFLPIEEKREPNMYLFIEWLQANHPHIKIIVPQSDLQTALMTHHEYTGAADLIKNRYGILEPSSSNPHTGDIDMVLVPLLAFDWSGQRVGYGKGFYDRFLKGLPAKKIGISLFPPEEDISDADEHDVRLDLCLTPEGVFVFN